MGGGLLQLVAYGAQDVYLTGNPQITFFKTVFRRHCNFSLESIEQTWNGNISAGGKIAVTLGRQGDLVSQIYLKTNGQTADSFSCIKRVDCEIGGQIIDSHLSHWMNIWCDLTHTDDQAKLLDNLRRGFKKVIDTVTVDDPWPILPNLGDGHVGTYPGTNNMNMIAAVNDGNHNTYFLRSITGNISNNSFVSKFKRVNVGQSNFNETLITEFQTTHSNSSSVSNYTDIAYLNNTLYVARGEDTVSTDDKISVINLDINGDVVGNVDTNLLELPGGWENNIGTSGNIAYIDENNNSVRGVSMNSISSVCANDSNIFLSSGDSPYKINKLITDSAYSHTLSRNDAINPFIYNNVWTGGDGANNPSTGGTLGVGNIQYMAGAFGIDHNPTTQKLLITTYQSIIYEADLATGSLQIISGQFATFGSPAIVDGSFSEARFHKPYGVAYFKNGINKALILDLKENTDNLVLREMDFDTQTVTTYDPIVGLGRSHNYMLNDLIIDHNNNFAYIANGHESSAAIYQYNIQPGQHSSTVFAGSPNAPAGIEDGGPGVGRLIVPASIVIDSTGTNLYVAAAASPGTIVKIDIATQYITHIAGNKAQSGHTDSSLPLQATFRETMGISISPDDSYLAIIGWGNHKIRKLDLKGQTGVTSVFGNGSSGNANLNSNGLSTAPRGIIFNSEGDKLYITESGSVNAIRIFETAQLVTTTYNPGYYIEQYTSDISNKVTNMITDNNNCIYFTQENTAGVFKINSYPDSSNTTFSLMNGSNIVQSPNGLCFDGQGKISVSCSTTHNIYKHNSEDDTFELFAGSSSSGTSDATSLTGASFATPSTLIMNGHNDLLVSQEGANFNIRAIGGYKPFTTVGETTVGEYGYIPLQFWFCRNPGLALPLIALQYHEVKLIIELADSLNGVNEMEIWADYIFLDTDERRRFAQTSHEYLIEQIQHSNTQTIGITNVNNSTSTELQSLTELRFNHPVKELLWTVYQESGGANGTTKACSITNQGGSQNIEVESALLQMNGKDRFEARDGKYLTRVQRYQNHTGTGIGITRRGVGSNDLSSVNVTSKWYPRTMNTHMYSFALNPEDHQPSSTCNFSRIDNAVLGLKFKTPSVNSKYTYKLDVYGVNYNVLRIMSGMGGLAYSN